jgi:ABC-type sugar transport system substrate-binding protein
MFKLLLNVALILLAVGLIFTASKNNDNHEKTIYYLATDMFNGFNISSAKNVEKFGKKLGYQVKILDAKNSSDIQNRQFETAMTTNPAAIMIKAVDNNSIIETAKRAALMGVAVIAYDNTIFCKDVSIASVLDTINVGEMAAKESVRLLTEKYGEPKGEILQVMGNLGDMYSVNIAKGFNATIKKNPEIRLITKNSPKWKGQSRLVEKELLKNKNIKLIFVHADSVIPSIIPILEAQGYKPGDVLIVGTDGDPAALQKIREGWIQSTIGVPLIQQVWGMYEFLPQILEHKKLEAGTYELKGIQASLKIETWGPTLYLPGEIITRENVDNSKLWGNSK